VSLQFGSSSSYVPWVKDTVIMKLFIMLQSFSLCLTSLLKWSLGGLT
jgi:hypothetical protein